MNNLQMRHLLKFCQQHELDPHLIDNTLTYSENKNYLKSLVPDFNPKSKMDQWKSMEEQYLDEHALSHYLACMIEGKTKSEYVGEVSGEVSGEPQFSLKGMVHVGFSLRNIITTKAK